MQDHGRPEGIKRPNHPTVENLREKLRVADEVLCELEHPKNTELRGRTAKERLERIEDFLKNDPVYLDREKQYRFAELKPEYQDLCASWYREEVGSRLKIFERLANRNPEMNVDERLDGDYRWVYRQIAREVYYQVAIGEAAPGNSIFQLPPFSDGVSPRRKANPQQELAKDSEVDSGGDAVKEDAPAPAASSSVETVETSEEKRVRQVELDPPCKLDSLVAEFRQSGCSSYKEAAKLFQAVTDAEAIGAATDSNICPVTEEERECLRRSAQLVASCKHFSDSLGESHAAPLRVKEELTLCELIKWFRENPCPGLGEYDPLEYLVVLEGSLTQEGAERLVKAAELITDAHPATKAFLGALGRDSDVSLEDVERFDECAIVLSKQFKKEQVFINHIKARAREGRGFVQHLENLVTLQKLEIDISTLLNIRPEQQEEVENILGEYRSGEFTECDGVLNTSALRESLMQRVDRSRTVSPPVARTVPAIMKDKTYSRPQQKRDIRELLLAVGDVIPHDIQFTRRLEQVCDDALVISGGKLNLIHVRDLICAPTREITPLQMIDWLHNLAELAVSGIPGTDRHVKAAHIVWKRETEKQDPTQSLTGFPTEARCVLALHESDFPIQSMSDTPMGIDFEFDAIGKLEYGRQYLFEVKHSLRTLLFKFEHEEEKYGSVEYSQPYRFIRAAQKMQKMQESSDKPITFEPLFVIESYDQIRDHDRRRKLTERFKEMKKALGVCPLIYDVSSKKYLDLSPSV